MKFNRFQPTLFEFLEQLADNNNRPWFQENKERYIQEVREPAIAFIRAFQPRLASISQYFVASDRTVGGSLMRVYRDTRFAKGEPYKTNVGIQFRHEQGRDIHAPGFYVHIAPGECFLCAGLWRPEPPALASIRQAIVEWPDRWGRARDNKKLPPPLRAGRREPEASAPRPSRRAPLDRRSEADGFHRLGGIRRAGRFGQGVYRPRGRFLRRHVPLHAIPLRRAEGAVLRCPYSARSA